MFNKVLVANRGEIAIRVIRACQVMGIRTVAIYSEADAKALHTLLADEAICIGPPAPADSYLNVKNILDAARDTQADAIHPGYGFLSENASFARAVEAAGLVFIGPRPDAIASMGNKTEARQIMEAAGVPIIPGYQGQDQSPSRLLQEADRIGYPVMVKASAGGGGKGMRVVHDSGQLISSVEAARREAGKAFGDSSVFLERYIVNPRHIEFQIFGDQHGNAVHMFERECSIQRRHQKVIEETPSIALNPELRARMGQEAVSAARAVNYSNAGTVEFILDLKGNFYFLEMNTRLQVEHPVTECVTGIDLVAAQLRVAWGEPLPFRQEQLMQRGHAIEARIYAEDPDSGFLPATGTVLALDEPAGPNIRVDSCLFPGMEVPVHYDPMLAKLVVWGADRDEAIERLCNALGRYTVLGVTNNIRFLKAVVEHSAFREGRTYTSFIDEYLKDWKAPVQKPGTDILVAAALAAFLHAQQTKIAAPAGDAIGGDPYSPWERLGSWRL